ncbi:hypothetical protein BpHYR1_015547 [Brachionus plicatilis]|uniref:Uncharacterized protein n=1 Tax=Brachionus plicatilis TaxID=10195 RepID=A0A3M7QAA2_BRAPC|nr:hypothetical protein BpHYR1_015547 [Brachionus plicatilis]
MPTQSTKKLKSAIEKNLANLNLFKNIFCLRISQNLCSVITFITLINLTAYLATVNDNISISLLKSKELFLELIFPE